MKIHITSLLDANRATQEFARNLSAASQVSSPIDGSLSQILGVSDVGSIHQRVLATDPGSAVNSLRAFGQQIDWLASTLQNNAEAFEAQESFNARGLDIADAGGSVGSESMPVVSQPDPGYSPFGFAVPVVNVGTNLWELFFKLLGTKYWSVMGATNRWGSLKGEVADIVAGLENAAASLEAENDSDATSAAAAKIREVAATGNHFIANAQAIQNKLVGFQSALMTIQTEVAGAAGTVAAMPLPAQKAAEQAALMKIQATLQSHVMAAMPYQHALMVSPPPSGGGDMSTGFGDVAGSGTAYSTSGVAWPSKIAKAIARGAVGPGSFGIADGQLHGLEGVGMSGQEAREFSAELARAGRDMLTDLGFGDQLPITAGSLGTAGADAGLGLGQLAGVGGGSGLGASGGSGGVASAANPSSLAAGLGAGSGMGGLGFGAAPGMAGLSSAAGRARGSAALGGAAGGVGGVGGLGGLNAGGPGMGIGAVGAGNVLGGAGATQGTGQGSASVAAQRGGAQPRAIAAGRGMMPMATGGNRSGEHARKVKSVTSQVELDPNRRDLLGEPPAVLPGVIGAWVREEH